jgi:hypothetical protein
MIRIQELRTGDIVQADFGGQRFDATVVDLNHEDKQICLHNGDQDDWFDPADLFPIAIDDEQLAKLGFEKVENDDKTVKYKKGPFRLLIPSGGQFAEVEIWYREDRRHIHHPLAVHELQNNYHQMTKVDLNRV